MPNIKSAKKRVIINEANYMRNKSNRSALKTALKKVDAAIETGAADKEECA
ncbi:MAG: 30S ribosomal protein S20, partial [Oscillospiraceae bacterium]